jgi:hypothetical protein
VFLAVHGIQNALLVWIESARTITQMAIWMDEREIVRHTRLTVSTSRDESKALTQMVILR